MVAAVLGTAVGACARAPEPPRRQAWPLNLWNKSQFSLEQIYVHVDDAAYAVGSKLLDAPLGVDDWIVHREFLSGSFVTVIRKKIDVGDRIAITSAEGIDPDSPGYTLMIFDDSFRLLYPTSSHNPWGDTDQGSGDSHSGDRDAGDRAGGE